MMPNAPLFCHYNGVTFPVETETTGMKITPVPDSSGRAVKHIVYSVTLKSILGQANQVGGTTTDATMATLRKRLTAYAGEFHYEGVGLGQLSVNVPPGGHVDAQLPQANALVVELARVGREAFSERGHRGVRGRAADLIGLSKDGFESDGVDNVFDRAAR